MSKISKAEVHTFSSFTESLMPQTWQRQVTPTPQELEAERMRQLREWNKEVTNG